MSETSSTSGVADPATTASADENRLIAGLRAGDEAAFMELVDRYQATLIRLAMMYVANRAAAEDVVQETWIGVVQGIDRFEGRSSLKTWLFRILTNRAKRRGERDHRSVPFSAAWNGATDDESSVDLDRFASDGHWTTMPKNWDEVPEERLLSTEARARIDAAIAGLPPAQREVITLRDIEGWSSEEVRNALALSETNQRVLLHRARAKVRKALDDYLA